MRQYNQNNLAFMRDKVYEGGKEKSPDYADYINNGSLFNVSDGLVSNVV